MKLYIFFSLFFQLSFQIVLHVPIQKDLIRSCIIVDFESENGYNLSTKLYHLLEELWISSPLTMPADTYGLKFSCTFKTLHVVYFLTMTKTMIDFKKNVKITPVIREFFIIKGTDRIENGVTQHLKHLIKTVNAATLKDILMETDTLISLAKSYVGYSRIVDNKRLFENIEQCIIDNSTLCNREVFFLFGYMCAQLCSGLKMKRNGDICVISEKTSTEVLKSLQTLQQRELPVGSLKCFENIVVDLCFNAFPNQSSLIVHLLEYCYPALSSTFAVSQFDNAGSLPFTCDINSCERICNKILEQKKAGDEGASVLLERFLQYTPISYTIDIVHRMVMHETSHKQELLNVLEKIILAESKKYSKEKNFEELLQLVKDLSSTQESVWSVVSEILKETVIKMVKCLGKSDSRDFPQVLKLMESRILFTSQESCEEIYQIIVASKNTYVHTLFLKLLDADQMSSVSEQKISKWVLQWFETAIKCHDRENQSKNKCNVLPYIYNDLNNLVNKPSVNKRDKLVDDLKEKAFKFLSGIHLKELMQKLCFGNLFPDSDFPETFGEHLIRRLSVSSDGKSTALTTIGSSLEFPETWYA